MPNRYLSNKELINILTKATEDERLALTQVLNRSARYPYDAIKLQEEICSYGGNSIANFWRGQGTAYLDIVCDVVEELNISELLPYIDIEDFDIIESLEFSKEIAMQKGIEYTEKAEEKIILKLLEIAYENMSSEEKLTFDHQINEVAKKFDSNSNTLLAGSAGLLVLGNLGGFATYTFLTSAMSTISAGTLGFGAYSTATYLLSMILHPISLAGVIGFSLYKLGSADMQKLIPIVAIVGAVRQRIRYEAR